MLIQNVRVIDPLTQTDKVTHVHIQNDRISDISSNIPNDPEVIDGTGLILCPGLVDVHVHFRDPGQTHKEDIQTGAQSAARGGYTHVLCMANTRPIIDTVERYQEVTQRMAKLPIHVYQAAAISVGFQGRELTDMVRLKEAGVRLFTDDGIPLRDEGFVKAAMQLASKLQVPLSFHEEDPHYIGYAGINEGRISRQLGFQGADRMAEIVMVELDINLAKETDAIINIQHISSKEAVELVRQAKKEGIHVHAEACPHHFTLNEEAVLQYQSLAKMNPPLREESDRLAIIEGLRDGTLDLIATDHAPHSAQEKQVALQKAPSGIIGLETAFALGYQELVLKGYLSLPALIEKMTLNPARLIGLEQSLQVGHEANFTLIDPNAKWKVDHFASRSSNSPFMGWELTGQIVATYARGKCVYRR